MPGCLVVLNGVPRSGKSSLAAAIAEVTDQPWVSMGVDSMNASLPPELRPGIGLRPGGERPDLEPTVQRLFLELYDEAARHVHAGKHVVMDVGHHDDYSQPLGILPACAAKVAHLPAMLVGVRCPIEVIRARRTLTGMVATDEILQRWESAVHQPGIYDLEIDTSADSPSAGAQKILALLNRQAPTAFAALSQI